MKKVPQHSFSSVDDIAAPSEEMLRATHRDRARAILRAAPKISKCMGPNRWTFGLIVLLVAAQTALAFVMPSLPWWVAGIAAYFVGATICHALFVLIHDCCHNLVFRRSWLNRCSEAIAGLPFVFPCAASFSRAHRQHHLHLGDAVKDPDVALDCEARWVGESPLRKILWLTVYPLMLVPRSFRNAALVGIDRWILFNVVLQLGFDAIIGHLGGGGSLIYFSVSAWFSVSLHPFGARWIQEHYMIAPPQQTYSYYGPANWLAFNIGYHNEHHDFPYVAWNRLPQVRRLGGRWYDGLVYYRSWMKLLVQFLFDSRFHLHRRMMPIESVELNPQSPTPVRLEK